MPFSGIGFGEMLMIALIVLVVFGPRRLPEISRSMGKAIREFKRGMNEIQRELQVAEREERWKTSRPVGPGAGASSAPAGTTSSPAETSSPAAETSSPAGTPPGAGAGPTIASPGLAGPATPAAAGVAGAKIGPWGSSAAPDDLAMKPVAEPVGEPVAVEPEEEESADSAARREDGAGDAEDPLQSDLFSGNPT